MSSQTPSRPRRRRRLTGRSFRSTSNARARARRLFQRRQARHARQYSSKHYCSHCQQSFSPAITGSSSQCSSCLRKQSPQTSPPSSFAGKSPFIQAQARQRTRQGDVIVEEKPTKGKCTVCDDPNCTFDPDYKEDKDF